jgi:hypothetical protein
MGWFSSNILVACSQEKSGQNQMVLQALAGIYISFLMLRDFGAGVTTLLALQVFSCTR